MYTFSYFSDYVHNPEFADISTGPRLYFTFEIFIGQFLKCANLYTLADMFMFAIRELKQAALSALRSFFLQLRAAWNMLRSDPELNSAIPSV